MGVARAQEAGDLVRRDGRPPVDERARRGEGPLDHAERVLVELREERAEGVRVHVGGRELERGARGVAGSVVLRGVDGRDPLGLHEPDEVPARGPLGHLHRAVGDARVGEHGSLDLGQLDAVAADLDLRVLAPEELDAPVGQVAADVARAVLAVARRGIHPEPLARALGVADVPERHARAADEDLAGHALGPVAREVVDHGQPLAAQGRAVGDARQQPVDLADHVVHRPDGRLGRAAEAHDGELGVAGAHGVGQGHGDPVAREEREPQRARGVAGRRAAGRAPGRGDRVAVVLQHAGLRGYGVPERDAVAGDERGPVRGVVAPAGVRQHHRAARAEDAQHVEDRQVEAEAGEGEHAVVGADAEALADVHERVVRGVVGEDRALGGARGPGRVDDVGGVGRVDAVAPGTGGRPGGDGLEGVDRDPLDARGPVRGRAHEGLLREHLPDAGVGQHGVAADPRLGHVHGYVGAAREEHADDGDDLLPAARGDDRNAVAPAHAGGAEP
ncbi:hypothetical protein CMMCAS04_01470 [Clavibacter michiganensis subsp. michiganensis]|nr:hypothetical protein CMMCAS04_01470 [Clavibacter michiganensis subsp. michiganensis]